jgi:amidase
VVSKARAAATLPPAPAGSFSEFSRYDALGLAELVRARQVTPKELVEDAIGRIEALNPKLNAVICKTFDRALRQCTSATAPDGLFAGVPFLVKDNAVIAGVASTLGSRSLVGNVPERTAPLFIATERAGLVLLGVTNMPEMGLVDGTENVLYGPTRNPWNLAYSPGGSSGGSGASVAAGILPLAHGTDGGGSIRLPASHCGLFGLKASRERLLPGSFAAATWPRLVDGALSRTVRDAAAFLSAAEDPETPLPRLGFVSGKSPTRLKIAVMFEGMQGQAPHPEVTKAIVDAADLCRTLGHTVAEASPQLDQAALSDAARQVAAIDVAKTLDAIARARAITRLEDGFESRALGLREQALRRGPFDGQIAAALPILKAGTIALDRFFQQWDMLLSPVHRTPAFKIGMRDQTKFAFGELDDMLHDYVAYTSLHNICGSPAMSVPLHWDINGLPLGSQFAARAGAEATLLALAYELEEARPWATKRPPTFATQIASLPT